MLCHNIMPVFSNKVFYFDRMILVYLLNRLKRFYEII